jgi:hypothetical protein
MAERRQFCKPRQINTTATSRSRDRAPIPSRVAATSAPAPAWGTQRLDAILANFNTTITPSCKAVCVNPPSDSHRRRHVRTNLVAMVDHQIAKLDEVEGAHDSGLAAKKCHVLELAESLKTELNLCLADPQ